MQQINWFDRKFNFDFEQNIFPSILERLSGTPLRLEAKLQGISAAVLENKIDGTWSIKENIGHLIDLEALWQGRFEDIRNGETELRPTDLQNSQTDRANYNQTEISVLLDTFRHSRLKIMDMLAEIEEELVFKFALHPRLKTPMRTIDLFLFVADHDDHHLARMTKIAKISGDQAPI
jgi:uncharacterized damage-inducible protein DinB